MSFEYEYPRAATAVDCVVYGWGDGQLKVMLIERGNETEEGQWALPGGFLKENETVENAAKRELREETGITYVSLEQLYVFSDPNRDKREHVISIAFIALTKRVTHKVKAGTDAADAQWFPLDDLPSLAFDHDEIIKVARERLKEKARFQPIGFDLLPTEFCLRDLQPLYEAILGRKLEKRNFQKKILGMGILTNTGKKETNVAHRAAELYKFDKKKYRAKLKTGFLFSI
ncbi:NUDIX hydrolase [Planctomycetota bacterium]|nr:NUDIX hydrolase [Planctomycetota bacterium]